ncbi:MAG: hypothetical protein QME51_03680 [Planctomycetota bacterium]|nr:hypothetical protein [Planctomycetota bacterium]MDI6787449.1 hypothetical protein [Planctomycetota bacterium]
MPKIAIRKKAEDPTILVVLILAGFMIIVAIVGIYFTLKDFNVKEQVLEKAKQEAEKKKVELDSTKEKVTAIASRIGWLSQDETKIVQGELWNNYDNLKSFLNRIIDYLSATYGVTGYDPWPEKELPKKPFHLQELITVLERLAKEKTDKNNELAKNRNDSWKEITKIVGTKDEKGELPNTIDRKITDIVRLRQGTASLDAETKQIISQGEIEVSVLQEGIRQINTTLAEEERKGEKRKAELAKEKLEFEKRLEALKNRLELAKEGIESDGKVILADISNRYVYIDIGAKDAIIKGMDFDVFTIVKGGVKKEKGKIKVIRIFDDYSQAAIIPDTMRPADPITVNDLVNSVVFHRERLKTFVFAGKPIGKYLIEDLKKKIEEFGGNVLSVVTDEVSYVVVGKDFEEDENYKKAIYLGAIVLREKELYDLLRIDWKE